MDHSPDPGEPLMPPLIILPPGVSGLIDISFKIGI